MLLSIPHYHATGFNNHSNLGKKKVTTQFGASSSSYSSSSTTQSQSSWKYDVFLSFRGEDTRNTFVGHLYSNLVRRGINTFLDNDGLGKGEEISPGLQKAIQESKISIVVFSKNYASSVWCMEELVKILQCKESKQQKVYPVFYKVDPADVRHQQGSFGQALAHHECRLKDNLDKVMRWREALTKAANLSGRHFSDGCHESKFIDEIVDEISTQLLDRIYLSVAKYPVGIESRVDDILKLLGIGENDVHVVGIWGVGGIGKTTIAKGVYNSIAHEFEGSCFLENVRETSNKEGLFKLQESLLSKTLQVKDLKVTNVDEGITIIKERLGHKKVLLILDDVNHLNQLHKLVGNLNWFGSGSRIIITTRDKHCLTAHDVDEIYEVNELSHDEALQLFNFNAFKENKQMDDYVELINDITHYAQGLPLALEVLGSYLRGRNIDQWRAALDSFRREPKQEIHGILKISYDALEDLTKEIFLHIACFFEGKNKNYVIDILKGCNLPESGIEVLTERALIKISEKNDILMHDLLEEMGKEIVRQESPTEPGERSRLWHYEDVYRVFMENTGTNKVRGIVVNHMNGRGGNICLNDESFSKLKNLQIFITHGDIFTGDYVNYLSNELRLLDWRECPLQSFPSDFTPLKLVALRVSYFSNMFYREKFFLVKYFERLFKSKWAACARFLPRMSWIFEPKKKQKMPWNCMSQLGEERLENLKYINLSGCDGVTKIGDLSRFPNLVDLNLSFCENLVEVEVGDNKNLVNLDLTRCMNLGKFEIVGDMRSLKSLNLTRTGIKEFPWPSSSIINLEKLILKGCEELTNVAWSIFELQHLQHLDLSECDNLVTFPTKTSSEFSAANSNSNVVDYAPLFVDLSGCNNLREISEFPREIDRLDASLCPSLIRISKLTNILEGKEESMIPRMNLFGCFFLMINYGFKIKMKKKKNLPDNLGVTSLLCLFLSSSSCLQSEFQVSCFAGVKIPEWFTYRMDCKKLPWPEDFSKKEFRALQFRIRFPGNFKWENKLGGLAFCAQIDRYDSIDDAPFFRLFCTSYINGDVCIIHQHLDQDWWFLPGHMWLYYVPFATIMRRLSESGLPPPSIVNFEIEYKLGMGSCGVHVVMQEEEEGGIFVSCSSLSEDGSSATIDVLS